MNINFNLGLIPGIQQIMSGVGMVKQSGLVVQDLAQVIFYSIGQSISEKKYEIAQKRMNPPSGKVQIEAMKKSVQDWQKNGSDAKENLKYHAVKVGMYALIGIPVVGTMYSGIRLGSKNNAIYNDVLRDWSNSYFTILLLIPVTQQIIGLAVTLFTAIDLNNIDRDSETFATANLGAAILTTLPVVGSLFITVEMSLPRIEKVAEEKIRAKENKMLMPTTRPP